MHAPSFTHRRVPASAPGCPAATPSQADMPSWSLAVPGRTADSRQLKIEPITNSKQIILDGALFAQAPRQMSEEASFHESDSS